jgi:tRNA(Ile2) C34 agmatinyltransferase TiaS
MNKTCFYPKVAKRCPWCGGNLITNGIEFWCNCGYRAKKTPKRWDRRTAHDIQKEQR